MNELDYIYNGDCIELLKSLPDKSIDLVVTDPPYEFCKGGLGSSKLSQRINRLKTELVDIVNGFDYENVLNELCRVMKKINIYIWCNKNQIPIYLDFFLKKGCLFEILVWHKTNAVPAVNGTFVPDAEWCLYFKKSVNLNGDYQTKKHIMIESINIKDKQKYSHPTIKPLKFIQNFIINSSEEGDVVLDPFMGSGTTAVACKMLNRHYIGAEINKEYQQVIKQRLADYDYQGLFG